MVRPRSPSRLAPCQFNTHVAAPPPRSRRQRWLTGLGLATPAFAAAPIAGGEYLNQNNLDAITVAKAGTSGYFTVTPRRCNQGLSIPGSKPVAISPTGSVTYNGYGRGSDEVGGRLVSFKIKLVIKGAFTSPTTLKWKTTITMPKKGTTFGYCQETVSSTLRFARVALK